MGPNYHYKAGSANAGFGGYHDGDFPFRKLADINDRFSVISDVNDVSGSEGVPGLTNDTITVRPKRPMAGISITTLNSPMVRKPLRAAMTRE